MPYHLKEVLRRAGLFLLRASGTLAPSEQPTLDRLYRDFLGREVDPSGREAFGRFLENGGTPTDVALALVRSEEFVNRLLRENTSLPDIRQERPEAFRQALAGGHSVPVFEAKSPADFDWMESKILENGYYEVPGVWSFEVNVDKRLTAGMLAPLAGDGALEIGCSNGSLLVALSELGVRAEGVEISRLAIAKADAGIRARIHTGDLLTLPPLGPYDLVIGLDIFEHLNPNRLDAYLAALARSLHPGGFLYGNIPAIGHDPVFGTICPAYLDEWQPNVAAGELFSLLEVDERGYPIHGHLAWAPSAWWEKKYSAAGFQRERGIEEALHRKYGNLLQKYTPGRLAFFVFSFQRDDARVGRVIGEIERRPVAVRG